MKNADLHGNVPDHSQMALLLIDVINDMEFGEGGELLKHALPAAHRIAELKERAYALSIPVIYVNDNFGKWRSDFKAQLKHCLLDSVRGKAIVDLLHPRDEDYFVLKPKHSGFYSTTLDILLRYLHAETLILTGFSANICVLFTANDAYMRDFELYVPSDCVASNTEDENSYALGQMQKILKADITPSTELDVIKLAEMTRRRLPKQLRVEGGLFDQYKNHGRRAG